MTGTDDRGNPREQPLSRRAFMAAGVGTAGAAALSFYWFEEFGDPSRRAQVQPTPPGVPGRSFDALQMRTAAAATDRLLPSSPGAPGARDVYAARYIDAVLATDFLAAESRNVLFDGLAKLNARARREGAREYSLLPPARQDEGIRVFETHQAPDGTYPGHHWLKLMLRLTLEAFLGDPVHGGNPEQIGWKWIGHKPPVDRPTEPHWRPTPKDAP